MDKYEAIKNIISENLEAADFAEFGDGVPEFWINKAQQRLKIAFPPSYIWWLKNYGGGYTIGDEVFSVYEQDFDTVVGGDIVYINELNRKNGFSDETQLVIQENDQAEMFYFDLVQRQADGEYPVYRAFGNLKVKYADDFLDFLKGRILDEY